MALGGGEPVEPRGFDDVLGDAVVPELVKVASASPWKAVLRSLRSSFSVGGIIVSLS
jgi:hypothetical protein